MPRQPTGRPRGRPRGTGQLENPTRLTVWLNSETYARLEAYADGRHYHRGDPQLSACVRELLEHALACPYKNQTQNIPILHGDNNRPIENVLAVAQNISEQIETITAAPENNYYEQIQNTPLVPESISPLIETVPPFDTAKHHLGKLCKRGHEWGGTGQSLKNADNQCLECRALAKREKDARKRAERGAQPVAG